MDLIRDIIDGLFCWWLEASDKKLACGCGCGCLAVLIVLGLVLYLGFWIGRNW